MLSWVLEQNLLQLLFSDLRCLFDVVHETCTEVFHLVISSEWISSARNHILIQIYRVNLNNERLNPGARFFA